MRSDQIKGRRTVRPMINLTNNAQRPHPVPLTRCPSSTTDAPSPSRVVRAKSGTGSHDGRPRMLPEQSEGGVQADHVILSYEHLLYAGIGKLGSQDVMSSSSHSGAGTSTEEVLMTAQTGKQGRHSDHCMEQTEGALPPSVEQNSDIRTGFGDVALKTPRYAGFFRAWMRRSTRSSRCTHDIHCRPEPGGPPEEVWGIVMVRPGHVPVQRPAWGR